MTTDLDGECKHHLAVQWQVRESEAVDRAYEEAEEAKSFFDYRYEIDLD